MILNLKNRAIKLPKMGTQPILTFYNSKNVGWWIDAGGNVFWNKGNCKGSIFYPENAKDKLEDGIDEYLDSNDFLPYAHFSIV